MILPIVLLDESLHQKSENLDLNLISKVVPNLFETLSTTTGVGLAAPQVGLMYRVFVMSVRDPHTGRHYKEAVINPEVVSHSEDTVIELEGCLSVPGIQERVERWKTVTVKYLDVEGKEKIQTFQGLMSRIVQHEIDHLNGVVFIDKLPKVRLKKLRHDLENIKNRKVTNINYRYK